MNGVGGLLTLRGFYPGNNPRGLAPRTNMLVLRTGFNF